MYEKQNSEEWGEGCPPAGDAMNCGECLMLQPVLIKGPSCFTAAITELSTIMVDCNYSFLYVWPQMMESSPKDKHYFACLC